MFVAKIILLLIEVGIVIAGNEVLLFQSFVRNFIRNQPETTVEMKPVPFAHTSWKKTSHWIAEHLPNLRIHPKPLNLCTNVAVDLTLESDDESPVKLVKLSPPQPTNTKSPASASCASNTRRQWEGTNAASPNDNRQVPDRDWDIYSHGTSLLPQHNPQAIIRPIPQRLTESHYSEQGTVQMVPYTESRTPSNAGYGWDSSYQNQEPEVSNLHVDPLADFSIRSNTQAQQQQESLRPMPLLVKPIAQRLGAAVTGEAIGGPFSSGTWHYGTGSEAFGVPKIAASVEDASEQVSYSGLYGMKEPEMAASQWYHEYYTGSQSDPFNLYQPGSESDWNNYLHGMSQPHQESHTVVRPVPQSLSAFQYYRRDAEQTAQPVCSSQLSHSYYNWDSHQQDQANAFLSLPLERTPTYAWNYGPEQQRPPASTVINEQTWDNTRFTQYNRSPSPGSTSTVQEMQGFPSFSFSTDSIFRRDSTESREYEHASRDCSGNRTFDESTSDVNTLQAESETLAQSHGFRCLPESSSQDLSVGFEELFANIFPLSRQDTAIDGLESSSPGNSTISERKAIDGQSSKDMDVSPLKSRSLDKYEEIATTTSIRNEVATTTVGTEESSNFGPEPPATEIYLLPQQNVDAAELKWEGFTIPSKTFYCGSYSELKGFTSDQLLPSHVNVSADISGNSELSEQDSKLAELHKQTDAVTAGMETAVTASSQVDDMAEVAGASSESMADKWKDKFMFKVRKVICKKRPGRNPSWPRKTMQQALYETWKNGKECIEQISQKYHIAPITLRKYFYELLKQVKAADHHMEMKKLRDESRKEAEAEMEVEKPSISESSPMKERRETRASSESLGPFKWLPDKYKLALTAALESGADISAIANRYKVPCDVIKTHVAAIRKEGNAVQKPRRKTIYEMPSTSRRYPARNITATKKKDS